MLLPRHLARMRSNLPAREVLDALRDRVRRRGNPISTRYHSNGGVPPGDWWRSGTLLFLLHVGW